jgi:hypothetical protein
VTSIALPKYLAAELAAEAQARDGSVDQVAAETLGERSGTEKGLVASGRPTRLAMRHVRSRISRLNAAP